MAEIDHIAQGLDRLVTQYSEAPKLRALLESLMAQGNEIEAAFAEIEGKRNLAEADGATLDTIGEIVGQPRTTLAAADGDFFGFWDGTTPNAYLGFSSDGVNDGGVFWDGNAALASRSLSDAEYSRFIDAKILRNKAKGTHREIVTAIQFLLGDDTEVNVQDSTPGTISIGVSRILNDAEQAILTDSGLVPISAGVGIESWYAYEPGFAFGLMDYDTGLFQTGSKGLADATIPTPDATPRTPWSSLTYLAAVDQWIDPKNGYLYKPLTSAGGPSPRSGLSEPIWRKPTEADPRFPGWSLGYSYDVEGMTEWTPGTTYASGFRIRPGDSNDPALVYVSSGGTSDTVRPVGWPTFVGGTISDGSIIWTAEAFIVYDVRVIDPMDGGILSSSFT